MSIRHLPQVVRRPVNKSDLARACLAYLIAALLTVSTPTGPAAEAATALAPFAVSLLVGLGFAQMIRGLFRAGERGPRSPHTLIVAHQSPHRSWCVALAYR